MADSIDLGLLGAKAAALSPRRPFPTTFVGFCSWLGVTLTPGQKVLCAVAYDGVEPKDLKGEDRDLALKIFGPVEIVPKDARGVFAAVMGARSGKSYVAISLRLLYGALTRDLKSLAPGQKAVALVVAPNNTLRRETISYAIGAMRSRSELQSMIVLPKGREKNDDGSVDGFGIRRPDGHLVLFEAGVAGRQGYASRGRSLTDFALDEAVFFRDMNYQVSDQDIFKAGSPRVLPGGQSLICSTPWGPSGLLYDLYKGNFGAPKNALVAHAPTLLMNPSDMTRSIVAREYERDAENANREFGAEFLVGGTMSFFALSEIDGAVDESIDLEA